MNDPASVQDLLERGPLITETGDWLYINWPAGRPEWFAMTPDAIEVLVGRVNNLATRLFNATADHA